MTAVAQKYQHPIMKSNKPSTLPVEPHYDIVVACAIIISHQKILVVQRSKTMDMPNCWEFPGGKLLPNETPSNCIIREIEEELHIYIAPIEQLSTVYYQYPQKSIKLIPFICQQISGTLQLSEHQNYKWCSPQELQSLHWSAADIPIIEELLQTAYF